MRIWVAGRPGGWSSEKTVTALKRLKVDCRLFQLSECEYDLTGKTITWQGHDLSKLNGIIVRKMGDPADPLTHLRVNMLYQLENNGVRVFSPPKFIEAVNNRYNMTRLLTNAGIPMPDTIVTESQETVFDIVDKWGKAVLKPVFTSKGRNMLLLDREGPYRLNIKQWEARQFSPYYIQRFIPTMHDIGVAVMGKNILGSFSRVAAVDSWQTTIRTGGHYEPCKVDSRILDIVNKIIDLLEFDYTVIDFVPQGRDYLVYEVSAFGGFSGLWECGIDAPSIFAKYVFTTLAVPRKSSARVR